MISTVTTTVVSVITTASATLVASLGLAAVLTLIAMLATKELANGSDTVRIRLLGHHFDAHILPLFFVFMFIVIMKVLEVLAS